MTDALFPPFEVPDDLKAAAEKRSWPDGLMQRAVNVRMPANTFEWWLGEEGPPIEQIERDVSQRERILFGTLKSRKATVSDNQGFGAVWANSPQSIGEWDVTVERSPNAFAQFRLQENVVLNMLEDRGLVVATQTNTRRDVLVGGKRMTVGLMGGVRVRNEFRRQEYSQLVMGGGGGPHPTDPVETAFYMYMRSQNFAAERWMRSIRPGAFTGVPDREGDVPGLSVAVLLYAADPFVGDTRGFRSVEPRDLDACVELISRTHGDLDLFRPYTVDFLTNRLNEGWWAEKPTWWSRVYDWQDFHVLEEGGRIVACGGLWDRGRDMREVWRRKDGSETRSIAATALLDFGFAEGRADAMARLVEILLGETARLEREHMMAPFQFLPEVTSVLSPRSPVEDTRGLQWYTYDADHNVMGQPDPPLVRPYTDLSYW